MSRISPRRKRASRRFTGNAVRAIMIGLGLFTGTAPAAMAEPLADSLAQRLAATMGDMRVQSRCVRQLDRFRLAYLGIRDGEPRLSDIERDQLNQAIRNALDGAGIPFTPTAAENAGMLLALSQTLDMGQDELNRRLGQLNADFTVLVQVQRPAPNIAQLKMSIYSRPGDGLAGCDEVVTAFADLSTLEAAAPPPTLGEDYFTVRGAIHVALQRNSELLQTAERLGWRLETQFPESCALRDWAQDALQDAYFNAREMAAALQPGSSVSGTWPGLSSNPGPEAPVLAVTMSPALIGAPGAAMRLTFERDGELLDSRRMEVVVPPIPLRGCYATAEPAPEEPERPAILSLRAERPQVAIGEEIRLFAEASVDCRLTILNVDPRGRSCVVLPFPNLPDAVLQPGETYAFPPRGRLYASVPGTETFVAMCNADAAALQQAQQGTTSVNCSADAQSRDAFERAILDTMTGPTPEVETLTADRPNPGVLRSEVTVNVLQPRLPDGMRAVQGRFDAPAGQCYLQLAQTASMQQALDVASRWRLASVNDAARFFETQDRQYAVILSTVAQSQESFLITRLQQQNQIPAGSRCVDGRAFVAEIRRAG